MDTCNIEEIRIKNIDDNQNFLKHLLKDFKPPSHRKDSRERVSCGKHRRSSADPSFTVRTKSSRKLAQSPYLTRSRTRSGSCESTTSSSNSSSPTKDDNPHLFVRFKHFRCQFEEDDTDEKMTRTINVRKCSEPRVIRLPEDITDDEIQMVADQFKEKLYDAVQGTTCHQCRQKTLDMKTICRSSNCIGTRGQFCGPCLRNRYGEDARQALKDPDWFCPACRGSCNCSICRRKSGKSSTGILVHIAKEEGFDNVAAYLESLKQK